MLFIKTVLKNIKLKLFSIGYYIPFTFNFLITIVILILALYYLNYLNSTPNSSYKDIAQLLIKAIVVFFVAFICFGLLTSLIPFLIFKLNKKKRFFSINTSSNEETNFDTINFNSYPVIVPFLGGVFIRLVYNDKLKGDKESLHFNTSNYFKLKLNSYFNYSFNELKEYDITNVLIYFEDCFRFFSFVAKHSTNHFYKPKLHSINDNKLSFTPTSNVTSEVRIEELKKLEGELINYKNFESNDDVRRIVWKIYAKNKDLVVRIPEILDPFASHVDVFVSSNTLINLDNNKINYSLFLNHYKQTVFNFYNSLEKNKIENNLYFDNYEFTQSFQTKQEQISYSIIKLNWQSNTPLLELVKSKSNALVFIHSLTNPKDVEDLLEKFNYKCQIIFVKLSSTLKNNIINDWVNWVFIEPKQNDFFYLKKTYKISPNYFQLLDNEKKIEKLLKLNNKNLVYN
ncbi:MAG: DUF58 domain-containing protein [Bacteroidia bacterium]